MKYSQTIQIGKRTSETLVTCESWSAFAEAGIVLAGLSDAAKGFSFVRHDPHFCQLLICREGEGSVWVDGQWVSCGPTQAYLTPPGVFHAYRALPKGRWKLAWIQFLPPPGFQEGPTLVSTDPAIWTGLIAALHRESVGPCSPALMSLVLETLTIYLHRLCGPDAGDERLFRLWSEVDARLQEDWTLESLAERASMSREHLRRLCRRYYGNSPLAWLRELRMKRASHLLSRSTAPIGAVAEQTGYEDAFTFSKIFKRHFGVNPSRYRQEGYKSLR